MLKSIERQIYKEVTTVPDKDNNYDHMNDALGYLWKDLFPVKRQFYTSKPQSGEIALYSREFLTQKHKHYEEKIADWHFHLIPSLADKTTRTDISLTDIF